MLCYQTTVPTHLIRVEPIELGLLLDLRSALQGIGSMAKAIRAPADSLKKG